MDVRRRQLVLGFRLALLFVAAFLMLRMAWLGDDALITLRTALNITHGWGPGFNSTEAVQAYTHPSWFLLWILIGQLTNQWILGILLVSVGLSVGAVALVLWRTASIARIIVVFSLLLFSNAFMDYTSSGLENPLAYLSIGMLVVLTLRVRWSITAAALIGLTTAVVFLTRMDLALLVAPVIAFLAWGWRRQWRLILSAGIALIVPVVVWFAWSRVTYDAWLPNTFEAKRNLEIPAVDLVSRGLMYLWVTFQHDAVSLIVIVGGTLLGLLLGSWMLRAWSLGVLFYLAYVVSIGGDFMAGRFVAVPVLVCVMVLAVIPLDGQPRRGGARSSELTTPSVGIALSLVLTLLAGTWILGAGPGSLVKVSEERWDFSGSFGVADERGAFTGLRGLDVLLRRVLNKYDQGPVNGDVYGIDVAAAVWPVRQEALTYPISAPIPNYCVWGVGAIEAGPLVHMIDLCGLTDRFMAGVPFDPEKQFLWRMGHFNRPLPDGYWEAIVAGDPSLVKDPDERQRLTELWAKIR
jgi:arabinofuranosyltransferase